MKIATLNNIDLHWREDGNSQGVPVVFANSLGTDLRLWDTLLPLLPQHLRLIRFDNRGHGLSSSPPGPYQMVQLAKDTEQLLDHLQVQACMFVGLSIGGMIGQILATQRPDLIRSMVLSNTAAVMGEPTVWQQRIGSIKANGMTSITDGVLSRWFSPAYLSSANLSGWRHMLERTPADGYAACCDAIAGADLTSLASSLRLPVMGIAGSEDGASPPDQVEATIERLDNASFHVIEGAGHLPCVEKPDEYAALLHKFIQDTDHE